MQEFSSGFVGAVVPCLLSAVLFDGSAAIIFAGACFLALSLFFKWVISVITH